MQRIFKFGFAPHQNRLHFLGRFEFEIFAEVAVGTSDADFLAVLGNFFVHKFFQLGFAFLQAAPGNDESFALFLSLFAGDETLQVGIEFDDARHKRTLR